MRLLITGGAGFIGSHLVELCLAKNDQVTVIDNLSTGSLTYLPQRDIDFWQDDIRDEDIMRKIEAEHFDAIFHLAAQTTVDGSLKNVRLDAEENILGTLNVLEAARKSGVKRVIFASTAAAYGDVDCNNLPVKETQMLSPTSFYGLSKVTVERYLSLYAQLFGLNYVICRFSNVYGERQGDKGEGGVISIFARLIAQNTPLKVYGNGAQTRDFIYVGDIVEGLYAALKTPYINDIYNISTQSETSINELIELLLKVTNKSIPTIREQVREGDIFRSSLSNKKAIDKLEWTPKMTLEKGLRLTFNYLTT